MSQQPPESRQHSIPAAQPQPGHEETQRIPTQHYAQGHAGGSGYSPYAAGGYSPYGEPPEYGQTPSEQPKRPRRRFGFGTVVATAVIAGLVGGGAAVAVSSVDTEETVTTGDAPASGIQINNPESATETTAAAAKASPSVVTLAVAGSAGAGSGSGIILDEQGHVLTNTHVVTLGGAESDPQIEVRLSDGRVTTAEIVGTDPLSDLAVVKLADTSNLTPADLGSSSELNVGDQTIAIGAPLGLSGTVTTGSVSTLNRTIEVASSAVESEAEVPEGNPFGEEELPEPGPEDVPGEEGFEFFFPDVNQNPAQSSIYLNVIQTDAAINQGNSGGALVNSEGEIIGVNVAIASAGGGMGQSAAGNIGVGFAIPIDYAQRVAQDIIAEGEATHGLLGVQVVPASHSEAENEQILEAMRSNVQQAPPIGGFSSGGLVFDVVEGSPAAEAGIEPGDVILEVDDRQIDDASSLTATIREYADGETAPVTVLRDGERLELDVAVGTL